jgi:AraC-like DNA-binding protein
VNLNYLEYRPCSALLEHVECFWTLSSRGEAVASGPQRILPDGCVELVLNFGDRFRREYCDGRSELQPRRFIVGQMREFVCIEPTGATDLLGIRFHPAGAYALLQTPLHLFTGTVLDLAEFSPALDQDLTGKVLDLSSDHERIAVIESALLHRVKRCRHEDPALHRATRLMLATDGTLSVNALMDDLGMSGRSLERSFLRGVGVSPKFFGRILRFQKVFKTVSSQQYFRWSSIAVDCGYYDQAHLIRDFVEFSGQTPTEMFPEIPEITRSFTRERRLSDLSNTLD